MTVTPIVSAFLQAKGKPKFYPTLIYTRKLSFNEICLEYVGDLRADTSHLNYG
jgi:hypothetical protein